MRKFLHEAKRVLAVARKPDQEEYLQVAKVAGLGILLIGFVGFVIMLISYFIQGMLAS
ncbi:MAG: preprotein translocase subunit SecE [Candidatus Hadarchaeum yellowstonense]|jgi:protein transport protein SEC61 subunit gamma-like protein|uniref:Protein translocase subunit SecE n=1 Tax=Hadarchaeum yellowstonense TaxID=1776334 RepID=A0A147JUG9_HADYE|nr:MAG: preprotein translocase subunit SecE [Candidatus Hadarchaeum yellowstonense]